MKYEAYNGEQTCGHRHGTAGAALSCCNSHPLSSPEWAIRAIPGGKRGRPSSNLTARLPQIAVDVETLTAFEKMAQADGTMVAELRRAAYKDYLTKAIGLK